MITNFQKHFLKIRLARKLLKVEKKLLKIYEKIKNKNKKRV